MLPRKKRSLFPEKDERHFVIFLVLEKFSLKTKEDNKKICDECKSIFFFITKHISEKLTCHIVVFFR